MTTTLELYTRTYLNVINLQGFKMQSHDTAWVGETVFFLQDVVVYRLAEHLRLGNWTGGEFQDRSESGACCYNLCFKFITGRVKSDDIFSYGHLGISAFHPEAQSEVLLMVAHEMQHLYVL